MRRDEVQDLFRRLPELDHLKTVVVLTGGQSISVETVFRLEPEYLVVRGREVGSNDEGRAFFVPYPIISYIKLERLVRLEELDEMFKGGAMPVAAAPRTGTAAPAQTDTPAPMLDPAAIAKQNLLERLRAARTSGGSPVLKPRK